MYTWYLRRLRKLQPSMGYQTIFNIFQNWARTEISPMFRSFPLQSWAFSWSIGRIGEGLWMHHFGRGRTVPRLVLKSTLHSYHSTAFFHIFPMANGSWKWIIKPWHICSVAALERTRLQALYDTTHIHPGPYTITSIPVTGLHECHDKSSLCNSTQVLRFLWVCDYLL